MKKIRKNRILSNVVNIVVIACFILSYNLAYATEITVLEVVKNVNESRKKEGLEGLVQDEKLTKVAQDKLEDMIRNNYFAHTSPNGVTPWFWFEKNAYDYHFAGENLAINFLTAEEQHIAWMNSPTHRKNILNPDYQEIGVAFGAGEIDGELSLITVQEFGTKVEMAGVSKVDKIFSVSNKGSLIRKENEIVPQVLSLKDNIAKNLASKEYLNFGKNESLIVEYGTVISEIILLIALLLSPITLLWKKLRKLIFLHNENKYELGDSCEYRPNHNQEILGVKSG